MNNGVLLDNWTFQDIGDLFVSGYDNDEVGVLVATERTHDFLPIKHGELQIQALYDLLTNVVLRDSLRLDRQFTDHWAPFSEIFRPIDNGRLFLLTTPIIEGKDISEGRSRLVEQLCVTDSLRVIQKENEAHFAMHQRSAHDYESQVMWGGAGMLARADAYRVPYVGHPCRQRFIESTRAWRPARDAVHEVVALVDRHKASIYSAVHGDQSVRRAQLILPSVAVEVISKASRPEDLFSLALDLRDKYRSLREWLGEVRLALDSEDTSTVAKYKKTLDALARDVERLTTASDTDMSFDVTMGWPTLSLPLKRGLDALQRRFSVRHDLLKLIKGPAGSNADQKLREWFK